MRSYNGDSMVIHQNIFSEGRRPSAVNFSKSAHQSPEKMKSIVVLLTVLLTCTVNPYSAESSSDDLFVMIDESKSAEDEGSGSPLSETIILDDTEEEERLFHKFPLHVFLKKKHPFVTHSTMTRTSTITALITSSTVGLCAQLVNVTGPCRLRKGLWVDDPVVLSFDDEMDSIDDSLSPSKTSRMETTEIPQPMAQVSKDQKTDNRRISVRSGSVIHSSKEESRDDEEVNEGRFGFFGLKKKFKKKVKLITVVTTTVLTVTSTSTYYKTVSTKSFFIQVCTPSPFPFNVCSGRKRRELEIEVDHQISSSHPQSNVVK